MPPIVASILTLAFVAWLFQRDIRQRPNITNALWLPFFWITFSATRFLSQWCNIFGLNWGNTSVQDGNFTDAVVFFFLIFAGVEVLRRRQVDWQEFMRRNRWVTIYLVYCLIAIAWSDFPFVAFKRWIKLFGQPVMVLVVLTEPDPRESFIRLLKRFGYVLAPLSVLFIKYYPDLGRSFDEWSGLPMNTGVTTNKNVLGCDCFILGLFYFWYFLQVRQRESGLARKHEMWLCAGFAVMLVWLFQMANSSTSLGVLLLASAIIIFLGFNFVDPRRITMYLVIGMVVLVPLDLVFGLHDLVIHALGRNTTLTGRTDIWDILIHWDLNPIIGDGFESFWLGDHVDEIARMQTGLVINEAHNGYLETYINIGLLGLAITVAMIMATYFKSCRAVLEDFEFGRFRLAYLAAFLIYNWTEAAFRTHCFPFFIFFLVAIDYPYNLQPAMDTMENHPTEADWEFAHQSEASQKS